MEASQVAIALLVLLVIVLAFYALRKPQPKKQCPKCDQCAKCPKYDGVYMPDPRLGPVRNTIADTIVQFKDAGCEMVNHGMILDALKDMAGMLCEHHVKDDAEATMRNLRTQSQQLDAMLMNTPPEAQGPLLEASGKITNDLVELYALMAANICVNQRPDVNKLSEIAKEIHANLCGDNAPDLAAGVRQGVLSRVADAALGPLIGPGASGAGQTMGSASAANGNDGVENTEPDGRVSEDTAPSSDDVAAEAYTVF